VIPGQPWPPMLVLGARRIVQVPLVGEACRAAGRGTAMALASAGGVEALEDVVRSARANPISLSAMSLRGVA
jgi:hypothetical protein